MITAMDFLLNQMTYLKNSERILMRETFSQVEDLVRMDKSSLEIILGRKIRGGKIDWKEKLPRALKDYEDWQKKMFKICLWGDQNYPLWLEYIDDAPYILFYRGSIGEKEQNYVGIVGTRKPSVQGRQAARKAAQLWSLSGFGVVSGLAWGIDGEAHAGALDAGGKTLAVMGTAIDRIYPSLHRALAGKILDKGGALLSQWGCGSSTHLYQFPLRNRIISGLSRGVLVVQAPKKSGAMGTAAWALEQQRELWVSAEGLEGPLGEGTSSLRDQGAKVITHPKEVLGELGTFSRPDYSRGGQWLSYWLSQEENNTLRENHKELLSYAVV